MSKKELISKTINDIKEKYSSIGFIDVSLRNKKNKYEAKIESRIGKRIFISEKVGLNFSESLNKAKKGIIRQISDNKSKRLKSKRSIELRFDETAA